MKSINIDELALMDRFYRANLINSISGFKPVSLIGTVDQSGVTNLAIFSNIVHLGADPAMVGFINRPLQAAPHTIANIQSTKVYTINHIQPAFLEKAHQTSAKYPEGISEFTATGIEPEFIEGIKAPFVKESIVKYALSLEEIIPIKINDTFLVIGSILSVHFDEKILAEDGFLDLEKAKSVCSVGLDGYYSTKQIGRYPYAKP